MLWAQRLGGLTDLRASLKREGGVYQQIESIRKQKRKWMAAAAAINHPPGQGRVTEVRGVLGFHPSAAAWFLKLREENALRALKKSRATGRVFNLGPTHGF